MTELGRLVRLVDRASATMLHVETGRITPMAVPLMVIVGREALPPGAEADEALLTQAEALAEAAMHSDCSLPVRVDSANFGAMKRVVSSSSSRLPCRAASSAPSPATAVDVVTLPVKVVSAGVDAATTSQAEADQKRGREIRKQDEERGQAAAAGRGALPQGPAAPDRQLRRGARSAEVLPRHRI